ncbi:hypothetical protein [Erythrobacter sp. R86502]
MNRAHALALPLVFVTRVDPFEAARRTIVLGCAAALVFAGQALPI